VNDTAVASVTSVALHTNAVNASALRLMVAAMFNNTNTVKGWLVFQRTDQSDNSYAAMPVTAVDISTATTQIRFTIQVANTNTNIGLFTDDVSYSCHFVLTGDKGNTGSTGAAGGNGTNGTNGTDGVRGSRWTSGSGAPGTISGQLNNDFYLNTANGDVYQLVSGTWGVVVNIKGPQGDPGASGSGGGGGGITALTYTYSSTTTDSDPGSGNVRFSASSWGTTTLTMYMDLLDSGANDRTSLLDSIVASSVRRTTLVHISWSASGQETMTAKVTAVTTASGYRKFTLEILNLRDVAPSNGSSVVITFDMFAESAPLLGMNVGSATSDTRKQGCPGFTVTRSASKNLTQNRAQAILFSIARPILITGFAMIQTTAPSAGGDRRVLIYRLTDMRVDGHRGGSLVYDSGLVVGALSVGVGPRVVSPTPFMLPPGNYILLDAIATFTGTSTVSTLGGFWQDSAGIFFSSNVWNIMTDSYWSGDLTGTPADPLGNLNSNMNYTLSTSLSSGFYMTTVMRYFEAQ
jgi:hypothetical protein